MFIVYSLVSCDISSSVLCFRLCFFCFVFTVVEKIYFPSALPEFMSVYHVRAWSLAPQTAVVFWWEPLCGAGNKTRSSAGATVV